MNGLFFDGRMSPAEIARIGQYAENIYFGKPCGLMDQMASSLGGLAGTALAFVPDDRMAAFSAGIAQTLGPNACCPLRIQSDG